MITVRSWEGRIKRYKCIRDFMKMKMTRAKHSNQPTEREQYVIGLKGHCLTAFKKPPN